MNLLDELLHRNHLQTNHLNAGTLVPAQDTCSRDAGCGCREGPCALHQGVCGTGAFFCYCLEKPVGISTYGKGVTKVNTEHAVPKVHESLKCGTVQLGRVPGHPGRSLGWLPAPSRVGRRKEVLTGSTGHLR